MKFYIAENGKPAGPYEANELLAHGLTVNSQVWNESMDGWQRASSVPELMALLNNQQVLQAQQPIQPQQPVQPQQPYQPPTGYETTPNPDAPYQPQQPQYGQQQQTYGQQQQTYGQQQQQWAQPQYAQPQAIPPNDWKVASIIVTIVSVLCCCNPLSLICGIVGIVNAGKVNSAFYRGDRIGAEQAALAARTWTLVAIGLLVIGAIVSILIVMNSPELSNAFSQGIQEGMQDV